MDTNQEEEGKKMDGKKINHGLTLIDLARQSRNHNDEQTGRRWCSRTLV